MVISVAPQEVAMEVATVWQEEAVAAVAAEAAEEEEAASSMSPMSVTPLSPYSTPGKDVLTLPVLASIQCRLARSERLVPQRR